MENTLPAPKDGHVESLPVEPGQTVVKGDILAIITKLNLSKNYDYKRYEFYKNFRDNLNLHLRSDVPLKD